jgi:hypothetical protein
MGSRVAPTSEAELVARVVAPRNLARVDLIRSGRVISWEEAEPRVTELRLQRRVEDLRPGEYLYVRVVQKDGGAAWSSPFFVE